MTGVNIPSRERVLMEQMIEMDDAHNILIKEIRNRLDGFVVAINVAENTSGLGQFSKTYPLIDNLRDDIRQLMRDLHNA